jgi:hypothetical protein
MQPGSGFSVAFSAVTNGCHRELTVISLNGCQVSMSKSITDIDGWLFLFARQISEHVYLSPVIRPCLGGSTTLPSFPTSSRSSRMLLKYQIEFKRPFIEHTEDEDIIELTELFNLRLTSSFRSPYRASPFSQKRADNGKLLF